MKPIVACAASAALVLSFGILAAPRAAAGGQTGALVRLQATTPGVAQTGHANLTGTLRAGQFQGGGSGLSSVNADLLDGLNSTAFLQSVPNPLSLSGAVAGIIVSGSNSSTAAGATGVSGASTAASGATYGIRGVNSSTSGRGVVGSALATSGVNYGGFFTSNSAVGYGVVATSAGTYGLFAASELTSGSSYGVYGESSSTTGRGVYGKALATSGSAYGIFGESQSTSGRAVIGLANATSGTTYGGYFDSDSIGGYGVFANSAGPYGVYGSSDLTSGTAYGIFGESSSSSGRGVFGIANAATGATMGVRGESLSASGTGVWGVGTFTSGTGVFGTGSDGVYGVGREVGVLGLATGENEGIGVRGETSTLNGIGVLGQEVGSNPAYGLYAGGDSGASGTKSFRIDHPHDPENKYLLHYSSESPFPQNFYSGNVVTDKMGKAWVVLPDYFQDINANFKYQLTVVDNSESEGFVQVKVGREIADGRFLVMTNAPHVKVSWRVEADRDDLYVRARKPVDVKEKSELERGKYQHPEFYGKPESMGTFYRAKRDARDKL